MKYWRHFNYIDTMDLSGRNIQFSVFVPEGTDTENGMLDCAIDETQGAGLLFTVKVRINLGEEKPFGHFRFSTIPAIGSAILFSSDTFVNPEWRRSPASNMFRHLKADIARLANCKLMLATADASNVPAYKNLLKSGYKIHDTITNPATGHPVVFGSKRL